jgi:hypothetical protein
MRALTAVSKRIPKKGEEMFSKSVEKQHLLVTHK